MEHELSRPGYRRYVEKRAGGSVWEVEEHAYNLHGFLLHQYFKVWKIALDRGLPLPPPPRVSEVRDDVVICVTRSERRLGVRWKEGDGRVFEQDDSGMVLAVDSRGERIVNPTFRRRRRTENR